MATFGVGGAGGLCVTIILPLSAVSLTGVAY